MYKLLQQKKAMCCGNNWKDAKNGNWSNNFERNKQIYSRSSYKHMQIHGRKVDGKGEDGAEYGRFKYEPTVTQALFLMRIIFYKSVEAE